MQLFFFFSSRRRHTRYWRDWSSDVCSSDLDRLMRVRSATRLHDLYEAVEDDEALSVFASTVAELCGARSANVLYIPPADAPFHQISYFPEDYVPVYLERFVAKDPWRRHALALGIQHRAVPMDDYVPPQEFVRTEMFNELFKPMGDDTGRCMGIDGCADGAHLHLAVHRPLSGAPFSMEDCARLEETFRHVARVMHLRLLLGGQQTLREYHETMMEVSQAAVIIVDERMRILAASPAAVECLDTRDGI